MDKKIIILVREKKVKVRDLFITFNEKVKFNTETKEEIYDRNIEIENTTTLYDIYRSEKKMNSTKDIVAIREKYGLNQSDYSLVLGLGKVTIHRYENSMLQTEANDSIITLSKDIKNMKKLLEINWDKISEETYKLLYERLTNLELLENHRILKNTPLYTEKKNFETVSVFDVAKKLLWIGDELQLEITPLFLQKILYFIQGISLRFYNKPAFLEKIVNWTYGPVIEDIYHKYKIYDRCNISKEENISLTEGLEEIIFKVLESYGEFSPNKLVSLTHEEDPWLDTTQNEEITKEAILKYFKKVYN